MVFGPAGGRHFYAEIREMEDYTSRIEEEPPTELELAPRVRSYRERQRQTPIREHAAAKEETRQMHLAHQEELASFMESLAVDGLIDFEHLPVLTRDARQMLLGWVARALHRNPIRTEMGFGVQLLYDPKEKRRICIHCEDGDFAMPPMKFRLQRSE